MPLTPSASAGAASPAVKSVEYLLGLLDEEFVEQAYRLILQREPDPQGRLSYLRLVRKGTAREEILTALARSAEGSPHAGAVLGLQELASTYRPLTLSFIQRVFGFLTRSNRADTEQATRRIENTLQTALDRVECRIENLDRRLQQASATASSFDPVAPVLRRLESLSAQIESFHQQSLAALAAASTPAVTRNAVSKSAQHPAFLDISNGMSAAGRYARLTNPSDGRHRLDDFMIGAYAAEDHGMGPVRWIAKEGALFVHATGTQLCITAAGIFEDREVVLSIQGRELGRTTFPRSPKSMIFSTAAYVGQDIKLAIHAIGTCTPTLRGLGSDRRELGLLIHEIHFQQEDAL